MTDPAIQPRPGAAAIIGRVFAGLVTAAVGAVFLLCAWVAVSSRFGTSQDAHGYGLIFGTFVAIVTAFIVAAVLPLVFPRHRRSRLYAVTLSSFVAVLVLLIALLVTA